MVESKRDGSILDENVPLLVAQQVVTKHIASMHLPFRQGVIFRIRLLLMIVRARPGNGQGDGEVDSVGSTPVFRLVRTGLENLLRPRTRTLVSGGGPRYVRPVANLTRS